MLPARGWSSRVLMSTPRVFFTLSGCSTIGSCASGCRARRATTHPSSSAVAGRVRLERLLQRARDLVHGPGGTIWEHVAERAAQVRLAADLAHVVPAAEPAALGARVGDSQRDDDGVSARDRGPVTPGIGEGLEHRVASLASGVLGEQRVDQNRGLEPRQRARCPRCSPCGRYSPRRRETDATVGPDPLPSTRPATSGCTP